MYFAYRDCIRIADGQWKRIHFWVLSRKEGKNIRIKGMGKKEVRI